MVKLFYLYLLFINLIGFGLFGLDKYKAIRHKWRIPEAHLLLNALLGGAPGCLLGMSIFRHKIRKPKFYLLIPLIFILEYGTIIYLFLK